jgi:hypothetical protein
MIATTHYELLANKKECPMEPIHGLHNPLCDCISSIHNAQGGGPERILPTLASTTNALRPLFFSHA